MGAYQHINRTTRIVPDGIIKIVFNYQAVTPEDFVWVDRFHAFAGHKCGPTYEAYSLFMTMKITEANTRIQRRKEKKEMRQQIDRWHRQYRHMAANKKYKQMAANKRRRMKQFKKIR